MTNTDTAQTLAKTVASAQNAYDQAEIERKAARRKAETSAGAKAARTAAKADPEAPGRYTRGGDRRGARAAEAVARQDPAHKLARNAADRAKRALDLAKARYRDSLALAESRVESQV